MKTENPKNSTEIVAIRKLSDVFAQQYGRRPRIMIAETISTLTTGDSKTMASEYAHLGFDVDIPPPYDQTTDIMRQAIESDVHILCFVIPKDYAGATEIIGAYIQDDTLEIKIILSADLREQEAAFLLKKGISAVFPRHITPKTIAKEMLRDLLDN